MPFFQAPHATLYYDIFPAHLTGSGSRSSVLLLHGFASLPESDFRAQIPLLRAEYDVLAPHLHGYGRSSPRSEYSLHYYREDVADLVVLLTTLQLERVRVLSFSDGSIVALLLAALHPHRVEALATLGAQPRVTEADAMAIRRGFLDTPLSEERQQELAQMHGDPYWRTLLPLFVEGQERLAAAGGVLITPDELAAIRCPTLIMHGRRDRIVSVDYAYELHDRIAGSHLLIFDAGHAAHLRCQEVYNQMILSFLRDPEHFSVGDEV